MQTPIALLVTSHEWAMVISTAGTSGTQTAGRELVVSEVRQTLSETHARKESEMLLSDREVSAHTATNTALVAQLAALQQELEKTKAENALFKTHVVERSSSSTSVNIQLIQLKEEIQNIRNNFIPKLNSIQTSQLNATSDITILKYSQSLLSDNALQLSLISGQMDLLQSKAIASDNFVKKNFQKVEGGMEHLNTGMMHLYNMIKKEHPPNAE